MKNILKFFVYSIFFNLNFFAKEFENKKLKFLKRISIPVSFGIGVFCQNFYNKKMLENGKFKRNKKINGKYN